MKQSALRLLKFKTSELRVSRGTGKGVLVLSVGVRSSFI
jgi:hypothetical protein